MAVLGLRPMGRQALCVLIVIASLASTACSRLPPGSKPLMLAWDYPAAAASIEGFLVQRRTNMGGWQEVGRVGATLRTAPDATAPRNTPLCYRVVAYRGQEQSPPSNDVCLTLPATPP